MEVANVNNEIFAFNCPSMYYNYYYYFTIRYNAKILLYASPPIDEWRKSRIKKNEFIIQIVSFIYHFNL